MDELKINYVQAIDALNEIKSYLKSDATALEQLFSSISSMCESGTWVCPNASMLKDYELDRFKIMVKHFEKLGNNLDIIENNLHTYSNIERNLMHEFGEN